MARRDRSGGIGEKIIDPQKIAPFSGKILGAVEKTAARSLLP
jgi:hypothetical protein